MFSNCLWRFLSIFLITTVVSVSSLPSGINNPATHDQHSVSAVNIRDKHKLVFIEQQVTQVTCLVDNSNPSANITWYIGDRELLESNNILLYHAVKSDVDKILTCSACNGIGCCKSDSVVMSIQLVPGIPSISINPYTVTELEPVNITCTDSNIVSIQRDGVPIINCVTSATIACSMIHGSLSSVYTLSRDGNSVTIGIRHASRWRDGVKWTCQGTGKVNSTDFLDVKVPVPNVAIQKTGLMFTDGETSPITCEVGESHPPPVITWSIDGVILSSATKSTTLHSDGSSTSILQYVADKSHRNKTLQCSASNNIGDPKTDDLTLNIRYPVSSVNLKDKYSLVFIDGKSTSVACLVGDSNPLATTTWSIDDRVLSETSNVLQYQAVKSDLNKILTCSVSNGIGCMKKDSVSLNIQYPVTSVNIQDKNNLVFIDGKTTSVTCVVGDSNPQASIMWSIGGLVSSETSNALQYHALKSDQDKIITCSAYNGIGSTKTDEISLDIKYIPIVHLYPSNSPHKIIQGKQLVLNCIVEANPMVPSSGYTWAKNGITILGQSSHEYIIDTVDASDGGKYTCTASNTVGSTTSLPLYLDVLYGPKVTVSKETVIVKEGSTTTLTCSVTSHPPTTSFMWYKPDGSSVSAEHDLVISSIKRTEAGVYRCVANNTLHPTAGQTEMRTDSKTTRVDVQFRPVVHLNPSTSQYAIIQGTQLLLNCVVDASNPLVSSTGYTWAHSGVTIQGQISSGLRINTIDVSDGGNYTCMASNKVGSTISVPLYVDVLYGPTIVLHPENVVAKEGEYIKLVCDANSNPQPTTFLWHLPDGRTSSAYEALEFPSITKNQAGNYTCVATNILNPSNGNNVSKTDTKITTIVVNYPVSSAMIKDKPRLLFIDGKTTQVSCLVGDSKPPSTITWSIDGRVLLETSNVLLYQAVKSDIGHILTCSAYNGIGSNKTDSTNLDIHYGPRIVLHPDNVVAKAGEYIKLVCDANSNPQPTTFVWYLPDGSSSSAYEALEFLSITKKQAGNYTCVATNILNPNNGNNVSKTDTKSTTIVVN